MSTFGAGLVQLHSHTVICAYSLAASQRVAQSASVPSPPNSRGGSYVAHRRPETPFEPGRISGDDRKLTDVLANGKEILRMLTFAEG